MGELIFMDSDLKVPVTMFSIETIESVDTEPATPNEVYNIPRFGTVEGTLTLNVDNLVLLSLLMGRKVTNNWLKMHGGVMRRKRGLRR